MAKRAEKSPAVKPAKPPREKVCPSCGTSYCFESVEAWKPYPFCTERCRLIDLGDWLDEKYQIADDSPNDLYGDEEITDLPQRDDDER